jgi:two-component system, LytTR family, sensor kinase
MDDVDAVRRIACHSRQPKLFRRPSPSYHWPVVIQSSRLPRQLSRLALFLGAWCAVVLFTTSQLILTYTTSGGPAYWGITLRVSAIQWLPWLIVAPIVIALARRFPLRGPHRLQHVVIHVVAAIGVTAAVMAMTFVFRSLGGIPLARSYGAEYLRSVHSLAVVYGLLVAGVHVAESLRRTRERESHVARLEVQLADARFTALQAQLHPHFLFNTLHAISSLIHEAPDAAEDMLTALSDLLRITLGRGDEREVALREDVDFLERYLQIEKMRLGDRLQVTLDIATDAVDLLVPSFAIQPLVENAIRYAIAPRRAGGRLEIRAVRVNRSLRLTVADDGPGLQASAGERAGGWGIGLENTRARLAQLYGTEHRFTVADRPGGGAAVTIEIPVRHAQAVEATE